MRGWPIPILLYHAVSEENGSGFAEWNLTPSLFAEHMRYLSENGYRSVTIRELVERAFDRREPWDPRTIAVTFDDGFADFHSNAWPHLKANSVTATVFVTTGYVGGTSLWLRRQEEKGRPMLSWSQIQELAEAGIEFGSHSHGHPQLDSVPIERAWSELIRSRNVLEAHVGPVSSFAYPHGYYTNAVRRLVARAGFSSGCAVRNALSSTGDDRFALARVGIHAGMTADELGAVLRGEGLRVAPGSRPLRRGAWRLARRAGAEDLLDRMEAGRVADRSRGDR